MLIPVGIFSVVLFSSFAGKWSWGKAIASVDDRTVNPIGYEVLGIFSLVASQVAVWFGGSQVVIIVRDRGGLSSLALF